MKFPPHLREGAQKREALHLYVTRESGVSHRVRTLDIVFFRASHRHWKKEKGRGVQKKQAPTGPARADKPRNVQSGRPTTHQQRAEGVGNWYGRTVGDIGSHVTSCDGVTSCAGKKRLHPAIQHGLKEKRDANNVTRGGCAGGI